MKENLSEIVLVIDRSGSMSIIKDEAEAGVNRFIEEQKAQPGEARLTLVHFDDQYDVVYDGVPIGNVPKYSLAPRGMTALLDAVGRAVNTVGERLDKMPEEDRPGHVIVVIVTDGQENSSHEFTKAQVREMVDRQQSKYNWKFTYLGAGPDAYAEGMGMGVPAAAVCQFTPRNVGEVFTSASASSSSSRSASSSSRSAMSYTDAQRKAMVQ